MQKLTGNNLNLDLVSINAYTKFGEILSFGSQDIEQKQNYEGSNDGRNNGQPKSNIALLFQSRAIMKINIIYYMRLYEVESYKAKCHTKECCFHIQAKRRMKECWVLHKG